MALQITRNINVDFYDKQYIMINAKQYDDSSRWIAITCYEQGKIFNLSASRHTAYVRYRKADERTVFNICTIDSKGRVLVELTEQMLVADGICYVDLVVVNKGTAKINVDTGEITTIDNSTIMSTMAFCVNVYEAAIDNSLIESSDEYSGLSDLLKTAEAEYKEVSLLARSYAIGDAYNIRENEDYDNAKYYCEQSSDSADAAKASENAAKESEDAAKDSEDAAKTSETNAANSESAAKISETNAKTSETNAKTSEQKAGTSEANAKTSETNAKLSEDAAELSETNARTSEINAKNSETNALDSANKSQSYAVGGTGTRSNEDNDNAYYYYEKIVGIVNGLETGFIPMGTIPFSELATAEKAVGFVYNISTDFITDESFAEGEGKSYTSGVNVYCRSDGLWDAFGGASSPTATIDEVRSYLGI